MLFSFVAVTAGEPIYPITVVRMILQFGTGRLIPIASGSNLTGFTSFFRCLLTIVFADSYLYGLKDFQSIARIMDRNDMYPIHTGFLTKSPPETRVTGNFKRVSRKTRRTSHATLHCKFFL